MELQQGEGAQLEVEPQQRSTRIFNDLFHLVTELVAGFYQNLYSICFLPLQAPAGKAAPAPAASKAPAGKGGHQCEATPPANKAVGGNTESPSP